MPTLKFIDSPYIVKSKGYSTYQIRLIYPIEYNKNNIFNEKVASQIIMNSSYEYPLEKDFINAKKNLLIIGLNMNTFLKGNKQFVSFNLQIPDPKVVKQFDLEKALNFFLDVIYKPNVVNGKFHQARFEREVNYLKNAYENQNDNPKEISYNEFIDIYDDQGYFKENMYHNMNLIDKANPKEIYQIYKKSIIDNKPLVFLNGDIDEEVVNILDKRLKFTNKEIQIKYKKDKYYKPFKEPKEVNVKAENTQSFLYLGYKIKNMKKEYEDYMILLKNILANGSNRLVYNVLRYKYDLLYYCYVVTNKNLGTLYMELSIENDKKDIALKGVNEVFKKLHDKKFLRECIDKTLEDFKFGLKEDLDTKTFKFNEYVDNKFRFNTAKKMIRRIENTDLDKFIEFLDNVVNDTIYFKEGEFGEN